MTLDRAAARPGDTVAFRGRDWVVCCPTGPFSRVQVFLERGAGRWLAGSAKPGARGTVTGRIRVPRLPPRRYAVEACGVPSAASGLMFPVCVPARPGTLLVVRQPR